MIRTLALAGGIAGAAVCSQYPEFAQQYLQRLAGQVDALEIVVTDFEASAMRAGLTRGQALSELSGTPFLADRQADMRRTFRRYAVLSDNLATLRAASPLDRITMPQRLGDPATFAATWADYRPAMPVTAAGVVTGGVGFLLGWALIRMLWSLLMRPFRRPARPAAPRRAAATRRPGRVEPIVLRDAVATPVPRLSGVRRDDP